MGVVEFFWISEAGLETGNKEKKAFFSHLIPDRKGGI
jgi:hypothetical protein